jgi:PilZ domain
MTSETTSKKRQAARDSLFLSTEVMVEGALKPVSVRVRNLSPGGMMIDGNAVFHEGAVVSAALRGIGAVAGRIAWVAEGRAGIAFDKEIDPKEARGSTGSLPNNFTLFKPPVAAERRPGLKLR